MGRHAHRRSGYVEGERVFGPPSGAFDVDWVASAAQSVDASLEHGRAQELADGAWRLLRSGTPADALAPALARRYGDDGADAVAAVSREYCTLYGVDTDPFRLQRFVAAQDAGGTHDAALAELRAGRKRGHWVWFVLPQLAGLGRSEQSQRFGLRGLDEAVAYAAHPVLGPRLRACADALLALPDEHPAAVLGSTDAQKLHSCATLFARAAPDAPVFRALLDRWYGGLEDPGTRRLLGP